MRVVNSNISDNHATYGYGGAIANSGSVFGLNGVLTVVNCVIANNSAGWGGGGIADLGGQVTIVDTEFIGNSSYEGGGLFTSFGTVTVRGCSFTENSAERGGGVYNGGIITSRIARSSAMSRHWEGICTTGLPRMASVSFTCSTAPSATATTIDLNRQHAFTTRASSRRMRPRNGPGICLRSVRRRAAKLRGSCGCSGDGGDAAGGIRRLPNRRRSRARRVRAGRRPCG